MQAEMSKCELDHKTLAKMSKGKQKRQNVSRNVQTQAVTSKRELKRQNGELQCQNAS